MNEILWLFRRLCAGFIWHYPTHCQTFNSKDQRFLNSTQFFKVRWAYLFLAKKWRGYKIIWTLFYKWYRLHRLVLCHTFFYSIPNMLFPLLQVAFVIRLLYMLTSFPEIYSVAPYVEYRHYDWKNFRRDNYSYYCLALRYKLYLSHLLIIPRREV